MFIVLGVVGVLWFVGFRRRTRQERAAHVAEPAGRGRDRAAERAGAAALNG